MATKPATPKVPAKAAATGTAVGDWQGTLAKQAADAASSEAPLSEFVSFKGGILMFNGAQVEGNEKDVIVLDSAYEHALYGDVDAAGTVTLWPYDADNPRSPACYAMGRIESELAPVREGDNAVEQPQGDPESGGCELCPHNEWGSDPEGGKGKACKNIRRLTLLDAAVLAGGPDVIAKAATVFAKLPVTSGKNFSAFVIQIANVTKRPPYGVIAKMKLVPDQRSQYKVLWEFVEMVPDALVPAIMAKKERLGDALLFPYQSNEERDQQAAPAKAPAKPSKYAPKAPVKPGAKAAK